MRRSIFLCLTIAVLTIGLVAGCAKTEEKGVTKSINLQLAEASTLESILKAGKLRVGLEAGYMPFEMRNKKGAIVGFDVDMANEMAESLGVELELINTAWDGIIPSLLTGKFDIIMSGMTTTQERNLKVNFAAPYIVVGQTILLAKKHQDIIKSYQDLNDEKYTVTSKLGTTGEQAAKRYLTLDEGLPNKIVSHLTVSIHVAL